MKLKQINSETLEERFLSPRDIAARWSVSPLTVRRRLTAGELPFCKLGGSLRCPLSAVVNYEQGARVNAR